MSSPQIIEFSPDKGLVQGKPADAGLLPGEINKLKSDLHRYLQPTPENPTHPTYSGAAVLAAKDGTIVAHEAAGDALRYTRDGDQVVELPAERRLPMRKDSIFDLASVSKLFTAVALMQLSERQLLKVDDRVATHIPEFAANGKGEVTIRQLLTHTSGMPASLPFDQYATVAERLAAAYAVRPESQPGEKSRYSDLGFVVLGKIIEKASRLSLDQFVHRRITGPLGMRETMYNPPARLRARIAATENHPTRGMIHGEVHDLKAWLMAGVSGHAGLFSTAPDLAIFCQMLLGGGTYHGVRILREDSVRAMVTHARDGWGLGFEVNRHFFMGPLSSPVTFGKTGFVGNTVTIDPLSHSFVVFLANSVHPDRTWASPNPARRAMTRDTGYAMPVHPAKGSTAWRAAPQPGGSATLVGTLNRRSTHATLSYYTWCDTEPNLDLGKLETATASGEWQPAATKLTSAGHVWHGSADGTFCSGFTGRRWLHVTATLPADTTQVRWTYTINPTAEGRGLYVDGVKAFDHRGRENLLSSEASGAGTFHAANWVKATS
ncbi:MAG: serine hydrolase domain-containing protein [Mycobacteriales bacterium]